MLRQNGGVCLRSAVALDWIDQLRDGVEEALANPSQFSKTKTRPNEMGRFVKETFVSTIRPSFQQVVVESNIAAIAATFMGRPQVRFVYDTWLAKYPGTARRTYWHQDHGIDGQCLIVWLPLDPVPKGSGVELLRGTHRHGACYYRGRFADVIEQAASSGQIDMNDSGGRRLLPMSEIEDNLDDYEIMSWEMEPGDCLVLDCYVVHGGGGNFGTSPIRRYSSRWMEPEARMTPHGAAIGDHVVAENVNVPLRRVDGINFDGDAYPLLPVQTEARRTDHKLAGS
ncbi:MAG: phytanoyl-CoA dioxygenase family protein [Pseudomonadota bacterium]